MKNCKYCNIEIKENLYCSKWCREQKQTERNKENYLKHKCPICGGQRERIVGVKEYDSYYKKCNKCRIEKRRIPNNKKCKDCSKLITIGHRCDECKEKRYQLSYDRKNETGIVGKCLNCSGDIIGYLNKNKSIKRKFCEHSCAKQYRYKINK